MRAMASEADEYLDALATAGKRKRKQLMRDILAGKVYGLQPRPHPEDDPATLEQPPKLSSTVVNVNRTSKQTRGGKVFSFGALVVSGNRSDLAGFGYGKGADAPSAISKASEKAAHNLYFLPLARDRTIFHPVQARFERTKVRLLPAPRGFGLRCGKTLSSICRLAGIHDIMGNVVGSRNAINTVKAAFRALDRVETPDEIAKRLHKPVYELDDAGRPLRRLTTAREERSYDSLRAHVRGEGVSKDETSEETLQAP